MKTDHHSSLEEEPGEKGELQFRWEGGCAGGSGLCPQPTEQGWRLLVPRTEWKAGPSYGTQ